MTKTEIIDDPVLGFIRRRFPKDSAWCSGNRFWFALILHLRFPYLQIYLFEIENHFMAGNGSVFYDWEGKRSLSERGEEPVLWNDVEERDRLYYNHLVRDCVM